MAKDQPPQALDAEMAVLGALLVDGGAGAVFEEVRPLLEPSDFYAFTHGIIYRHILRLTDTGVRVDKITLAESLRASNDLERVGSISYLSLLMETVQTASSARFYAIQVANASRLRGLMQAATSLYNSAQNGMHLGPSDVAGEALARIERITEVGHRQNFKNADEASVELMTLIDSGGIQFQHTQFPGLNSLIGGFTPGELVIIGAAPGVGKSALVNTFAHFFASMCKLPIAQFCLEMGTRKTVSRYAAMLSGIPSWRIYTAQLTDDERNLVADVMSEHFFNLPLRLYDKLPGWSVAEIRIAARKWRRENGGKLGGIFIDHIGFLTDILTKGEQSKHELLDQAFKELLNVAAELDTTVFAVQHINRNVKEGLPSMFDLRDGGNPEGNAHTIIIPWRPRPKADDPERRAEASFIVEKAREGDVGKVNVRFWGHRAMWVDEQKPYPWWQREPADPIRIPAPEMTLDDLDLEGGRALDYEPGSNPEDTAIP